MELSTQTLTTLKRAVKVYERTLKELCEKFGLTPIELNVTGFLARNPDRDTASEISQAQMLTKGNVSQAVESLMRRGLLQRHQDPADRRRIHLSLTAAAAPVVEEREQTMRRFLNRAFMGFTEQECNQFEGMCQRLLQNMASCMDHPCPPAD